MMVKILRRNVLAAKIPKSGFRRFGVISRSDNTFIYYGDEHK